MGVPGGGGMVGHAAVTVAASTGPALTAAAPGHHGQLDDVAMEPAEGAGEVHHMLGSPTSAQ